MDIDRTRHLTTLRRPWACGALAPVNRCTTRSRKILQFKHYCTDAPI
jgi:hypothetical protein